MRLVDGGGASAMEVVYIPEGSRDDWRGDSDPTPAGPSADAPRRYRGTLCVSSQAGCALDCAFCSTGKQGFNRNLSVAEIIGQLWHANRTLLADGVTTPCVELGRHPVPNVYMLDMGQPLADVANIVAAP